MSGFQFPDLGDKFSPRTLGLFFSSSNSGSCSKSR